MNNFKGCNISEQKVKSKEISKQIKTWEGHAGLILDSVKGFDVIECEVCGFKHIIPIPGAEEMANYYKTEFVAKRPELIDEINEDMEWWSMVHDEKYDCLEQLISRESRSLLDIGCGLGFFLHVGKQRGWDVLGIEPSGQSAEHARKLGLEVLNIPIDKEIINQLGKFNVIHMHEVLEHLSNPVEAIKLSYDLLMPGGLLCILVPNDYNILQNVLRNQMGFKPWWLAPPEHINYFNGESLQRVVKAEGFEIVLKTATFPMEMFLLMGLNYIGNDQLGRQCHSHRKNFELNLQKAGLHEIMKKFHKLLAQEGIGREILLIARKKA